jgi:hypothetical protein
MGGGSYDRDWYSADDTYSKPSTPSRGSSSPPPPPNPGAFRTSSIAAQSFTQRSLDPALNPKNRRLACTALIPIAVSFDHTGSMGDGAKVVYDKFPMVYGELKGKGYIDDDFAISFSAVGDHKSDAAPFQVCDFDKGTVLDSWLKKIWLEKGGGPGCMESYELLAWYYLNCVDFNPPKKTKEKPYFFLIGDEQCYPTVKASDVQKHFGVTIPKDIPTAEVFKDLMDKYNFFHLHKPYGYGDDFIVEDWNKLIGQNIITMAEPNSVADLILGLVALTSGARDWEGYEADMKARGQTAKRIANVKAALAPHA